jgi:hypothetical protein
MDDKRMSITPEMTGAGVQVMRDFLFEGSYVFRSDHVEMVEAIWRAMNRALVSPSAPVCRQSEGECPESIAPIVLMERESSELGREYLVLQPRLLR